MCGFLGVYGPQQTIFAEKEVQRFRAQSSRLAHRGNTGKDEFHEMSVALFHYRLAFRGLQDGAQPMSDASKRATLIFNGELYDYRVLQTELKKSYEFQSHADTEVILASYLVHGAEKFLQTFDGEYAFALLDRKLNTLFAARDPFGVKPIFLGADSLSKLPADFFRTYQERYNFQLPGTIAFASEMKALPQNLRWSQRGMERQILGLYEEISTAFENVIQLPPGALFTAKRSEQGWDCVIERKIPKNREKKNFTHKDFFSSAKELKEILHRTVKKKLDAEVPLGAYLSGGIDSRIAAFEMSQNTSEKIQTFTVGFEGKDFDETDSVKEFLKSYKNLEGRALRTTDASLEYSYPHAIYSSELIQPYTNGAAKWWLSRFARRHVRGVLTGDGADEIFCGYPSYRYLAWWRFYQRHPSEARAALYADRVGGKGQKFWEKGLSSLEDGSDLKESQTIWGWEHPLFSQVKTMVETFHGGNAPAWLAQERAALASYVVPSKDESPLTRWQNYFLHTHFPTHVLNWVGDRMEMANTLEGRPIFISREILNFMRTLPDHFLVRGMRDKAILRAAYAKELQHFSRAPKKQFNAPFLQDGKLAQELLSDNEVRASGLIDPAMLARLQNGLKNSQDPLERSYLTMLKQNLLVLQLLNRHIVKGEALVRDIGFEEKFLDTQTEML